MPTRRTTLMSGVGLLAVLLTAGTGSAAVELQFGRPRLTPKGKLSIPIVLSATRADDVSAMNFTVRSTSKRLQTRSKAPSPGRAVRKARAELTGQTDEAGRAVTVIVIPEFAQDFPALRKGRVATVYFDLDGDRPSHLRRWVQRNVAIEQVVVGDGQGREVLAGVPKTKGEKRERCSGSCEKD